MHPQAEELADPQPQTGLGRYDLNGNRTTVTTDGVQSQALAVRTADNQVTTTGYGYDRAGNTTATPEGTLAYNGAGQMTDRTGPGPDSSYAYAGPGQNELITRTVAGGDTTKYVYGRPSKYGVPMVDVMTVNGAKHYLDNDPDGTPLALELPSGGTGYFVLDGLGSVVALVDGQGNTDATYTYDPYGTQTASTGTGALADANPYRHTTGLHDPTTGYVKHGTRWNDTTTGRWVTTDPITRLNDPSEANPYIYAGGDPINNVDLSGLDWRDFLASTTLSAAFAMECWAIGSLLTTPIGGLAFAVGCAVVANSVSYAVL